jgi:hypothetical protein
MAKDVKVMCDIISRAETRHLGGSFGSLTMKRFSLILLQHCLVKPIPVVEIV